MKFAVGMIVRSRATRNSRSMIGVITGWNELRPNFDVTLEPFDDDQCPCDRYYTILCEDERSYYFSEGISRSYYINYIMLNFLYISIV
jgi:hypothetical protein